MSRVKWLCAMLIGLLWVGPAWGMGRGVFVNGKVHFFYLDQSAEVCHSSHNVDSNGMLNPKYDSERV